MPENSRQDKGKTLKSTLTGLTYSVTVLTDTHKQDGFINLSSICSYQQLHLRALPCN